VKRSESPAVTQLTAASVSVVQSLHDGCCDKQSCDEFHPPSVALPKYTLCLPLENNRIHISTL